MTLFTSLKEFMLYLQTVTELIPHKTQRNLSAGGAGRGGRRL